MRWFVAILLLIIVFCWSWRQQSVPMHTAWRPPVDSATLAAAQDSISAAQMVAFAKTLLGTKYTFGCMAPSTGFDCSGFINYIFTHFSIEVPRSSVDFTNAGTTVPLDNAHPGDLILFTGTNSKVRTVGHIGMVVSRDTSGIQFIHASSGSEDAVIITPLDGSYVERFVKVVRIDK